MTPPHIYLDISSQLTNFNQSDRFIQERSSGSARRCHGTSAVSPSGEAILRSPEAISRPPEADLRPAEAISRSPKAVSRLPEAVSSSPNAVSRSPEAVLRSAEAVSRLPEMRHWPVWGLSLLRSATWKTAQLDTRTRIRTKYLKTWRKFEDISDLDAK